MQSVLSHKGTDKSISTLARGGGKGKSWWDWVSVPEDEQPVDRKKYNRINKQVIELTDKNERLKSEITQLENKREILMQKARQKYNELEQQLQNQVAQVAKWKSNWCSNRHTNLIKWMPDPFKKQIFFSSNPKFGSTFLIP